MQYFSDEGEVYCVNTITSGATYFTTVFNPGSVDGINFHRFTCYVSIESVTFPSHKNE